jgi:hypothetical protein
MGTRRRCHDQAGDWPPVACGQQTARPGVELACSRLERGHSTRTGRFLASSVGSPTGLARCLVGRFGDEAPSPIPHTSLGRSDLRRRPSERKRRRCLLLVMPVAEAHYGCMGGRPFLTAVLTGALASSGHDHLIHKPWIERVRWRLSHPLIFCAWCGRVRFAGHWFGKPRELEVVAHAKRQATSGICPSCFAELNPGPRS